MGFFSKTLQAAMPKMIGNPLSVATAMVSFALSVVKGQKAKKATKGKKKTTVRKSKILSKKQKQQMEVMERICQSVYGTYIRGATTIAARYIGHPAVAIPASEMVKTMMDEVAPTVNYLVQLETGAKKENAGKEQKEGNILEYAKKGAEYVEGYYDSYWKAFNGEQVIDEKYTLENLFSGNLTIEDIPDIPELINMVGATKGALSRGVWNSAKGTFDTVKTLVTEPGKVWDAVSSGASDFIEHPWESTKEFVSGKFNDAVDAVWRSTPQDMAEDVGEIVGDVAVDALTAGSGAVIVTGLKTGAKKLTISAGKTVTKTVTKTAGKTITKTVTKTTGKTAIKEAGKKTIKELMPDATTVKKWIPKDLPINEGWLKNVVTAGGDINALKKNNYQLILPNDKKSIKDILQKTTQNTAKETAGEFAENKAVNLTKDKIVKETKKEVVEEVKDKAIDVTENKVVNAAKSEIKDEAKDKIVNEVKDKTVDIAKGKVVEEIKDVTQKIVNENSNRRGKNGVHTSPAVNETKVDKIKATRTDSNNIEKDKAPTNEQIPEAKIHEITHRRLSEKVKEIRNKFKELRKENEEIIPKHIAEHGNIAVAEIDIPGVPKEFMAHSSINTPNAKAAQYGTFVYKPKPEERNLKSYIKAATGTKGLTKEEILKKKRVDRYHDSEAKILENITSRIKDTPNVKGKIDLYTERDCCDSCKNLISEFRNKFPNIELNIYTDNF